MRFRLPISKWAIRQVEGSSEAKPDLNFVDPMLRRRLSPLARAALHVANDCASDLPTVPVVYASRHGELTRTVELLRSLAREEALSPTTFSLSVLNSAAGAFSIARGDPAPAIALAAGTETLGWGLLDAACRAQLNPQQPTLFIYADGAAPPPLGPLKEDPEQPYALAVLLDAKSDTFFEVSADINASAASCELQAASFVRALGAAEHGHGSISSDAQPSYWFSGHRRWTWQSAGVCKLP